MTGPNVDRYLATKARKGKENRRSQLVRRRLLETKTS